MLEILKLVWDGFVIRGSVQRGQLNWRRALIGVGFAVLEYLIVLPVAMLYFNHPAYKPLFIGALVLAGLLFIGMVFVGVRWYRQSQAAPRLAPAANERDSRSAAQ